MPIPQSRLLDLLLTGENYKITYDQFRDAVQREGKLAKDSQITWEEAFSRIAQVASIDMLTNESALLYIERHLYRSTHKRNERDKKKRRNAADFKRGTIQPLSIRAAYSPQPDTQADEIEGQSLGITPSSPTEPSGPTILRPAPPKPVLDLVTLGDTMTQEEKDAIDREVDTRLEQESRQRAILAKLAEPDLSTPAESPGRPKAEE